MTTRAVVFEPTDKDGCEVRITLTFETAAAGSELDNFSVDLEAPSLACQSGDVSWRGDGLDAFFDDLCRDWRGWTGERVWTSLEQVVAIRATHERSRVRLVFVVEPRGLGGWRVEAPVEIEPGEALRALAGDVTHLVRRQG